VASNRQDGKHAKNSNQFRFIGHGPPQAPAEMERELTIERTRAGLDVARQLGRKGGRKRQMTESKIKSAKKLLASGVPPRDVASNLGVSVPTLYRWIPASNKA
jgi:DNA invertase Pin-like site-specific DNA recombinase